MRSRKLARRYAQALGELAHERDELGRVEEDLAYVRQVLLEQPSLAEFLADQNRTDEEKDRIVASVFGSRLSRVALNFVRLVTAKRRGAYLSEMIEEFFVYADEMRGVVEVEVTTAAPLGDTEERLLVEKLSEITGRQVRLKAKQDVTILGGVIARVGDMVMDGSVKTRLESLRESLLHVHVN